MRVVSCPRTQHDVPWKTARSGVQRPHPVISNSSTWLVTGSGEKSYTEKVSLIANVIKQDPVLEIHTFLTPLNIPEVNASTIPIHRRREAILCIESWLYDFNEFIVTHRSLLMLADCTSEDYYWDIFFWFSVGARPHRLYMRHLIPITDHLVSGSSCDASY